MVTNLFEAVQQFSTALSSTFARRRRSSVKRTPFGVGTIALGFGAIASRYVA